MSCPSGESPDPCLELVVMHASHFRLSRISGFCAVILALLALVLVVLVQAYSVERSRLRGAEKDVTYGKPEETKHFWKYEMPGLQGPRAVSAEASKLADGEEVIGVVIDGKPRAYWLKASGTRPGISSTMSSREFPSR